MAEDTKFLVSGIYKLLFIEENTLFPNCLELLTEEDWIGVCIGEEEIGWMLPEKPAVFPAETKYIHPSQNFTERGLPFSREETTHYDEGFMSVEQVNLLLKTMPLDLTYVVENDRVIFYNRGEERIFPRSAVIIEREVKFCHPYKNVTTVLRFLEEFRKGTKSGSAFWIKYKERLIYIQYFRA